MNHRESFPPRTICPDNNATLRPFRPPRNAQNVQLYDYDYGRDDSHRYPTIITISSVWPRAIDFRFFRALAGRYETASREIRWKWLIGVVWVFGKSGDGWSRVTVDVSLDISVIFIDWRFQLVNGRMRFFEC